MKSLLLAATIATFAAGSALAGGLADEFMEAPVIEVAPEPTGTLPGWVIPLAIIGIVIAVASSDSEEDR